MVESDPDKLGGTVVFKGTRVPVQSLFDYIKAGDRLDEFLRDFPTVSREAAIAVLDFAKSTVVATKREDTP